MLFVIHLLLNAASVSADCRSLGDWKGNYGKDIVYGSSERGNNLESFNAKSLSECKALCQNKDLCFSIHYHPYRHQSFANCNLKDKQFTDQSQITHNDGHWTYYWLDCSSGEFHEYQ